jgi:hypothetical protein
VALSFSQDNYLAMALGALGGWEPLLLLVLIALTLGLDLAALRAIFQGSNHSQSSKYAWMIIILLLPVLGALIYILMRILQKDG